MAFFGEFKVSITSGDRVVIPKKIREQFEGNVFILTKGFNVCLAGYDKRDWETRSGDLINVSLLDREYIDRKRMLFSAANEIEIDEQGRFIIPKALLEYIGKTRTSVVIIGVGDHFEIWDQQQWQDYKNNVDM